MYVLGRERDRSAVEPPTASATAKGPTVRLGSFLARDGSAGAPVHVDADRPHAAMIVGKRGTGKSYSLGVLAEGLADVPGVAPIVIDPMGVFGGLKSAGGTVVDPIVRPTAVPASAWPELLGLDPTGGPGGLLWRSVADAGTRTDDRASEVHDRSWSLSAVSDAVADADAPQKTRRVVRNHLELAISWGVFDADAPSIAAVTRDGTPTVIDLAGVPDAAAGAVVRAIARGVYDARIDERIERLPWLLVDEVHAFFDGIADPALRRLLTRGRAPGVSLVCATQRPGVLPPVAMSQSDLIVAHRLTAERDVDRLREAEATYLAGDIASRLPEGTGEALVVDDATESVHTVSVRERRTPHGGESPRASETTIGRST